MEFRDYISMLLIAVGLWMLRSLIKQLISKVDFTQRMLGSHQTYTSVRFTDLYKRLDEIEKKVKE